ncbi:hypothetical protein ACJIZ3_010587 [Penstemon smallii]|uniref:Elongin-A n=1 Tax=Penstemon smallii TaxID=265156 RepID=A0ABD3UH14_9LAMI
MMRKVPSLVDLCVRVAVDNVRYIGNVGETENHLLERILPHCTLDQLKHIEDSTENRDLSPITDKLWKEFYKRQFGDDSINILVERMRQKKVMYKWKQLYEAKLKEREKATQESCDRLRKRYLEVNAKKQSRQVQLCTKVPSSSAKRSYSGGVVANNIYNTKSGLMKKAKIEFINSREVKNIAAMKNKAVQRSHSVSSPVKRVTSSGPSGLPSSSSSSSKLTKPIQRRF